METNNHVLLIILCSAKFFLFLRESVRPLPVFLLSKGQPKNALVNPPLNLEMILHISILYYSHMPEHNNQFYLYMRCLSICCTISIVFHSYSYVYIQFQRQCTSLAQPKSKYWSSCPPITRTL
jgi:hypothetical protein